MSNILQKSTEDDEYSKRLEEEEKIRQFEKYKIYIRTEVREFNMRLLKILNEF